MSLDPRSLPPGARDFLGERHLATLTTLRADGSPHVVAVGFTWDAEHAVVRVITSDRSQKVRNADRAAGAAGPAGAGGRAAVCQVDGRRWLTLEGLVTVRRAPAEVARAVRLYADRYRQPRDNPARVVVEIAVDRVLGSV
jgi:PPOX class probable F420-dependent enzyme